MTELYIYSQNDEPLTIISEDTGLVDTHYRIEVNSVPDTPFSFTVEADSENAKYVKDENKVVYRDHEGDLRLVVIKELEDSDSIDGSLTTAICEPEFMELTEHIVVDRRFTDRTAQFMLDAALEGTRYIGEVEVELGLGSTNFYYLTSVEAIWKIIEVMGGEFKDVVEFDNNNNIVARKIKLLQRLGADTGQRFEIDHNITEIGRTVLSYPKTAMYGRGASLETEGGGNTRYIDFADVEWKKSNGDPVDKPLGQKWVGDPDALQVYGRPHNSVKLHRYGIFSNQDYEDPEEILWATWQNLQANKQPEVNYRLSVDLFDDKVSLGDTAIAIDRYFSRPIEIQARVIAMEYDLLDIEGTMIVEMGQFLNLDDNRLDEVINEVEKIRNRPSKVTEDSYPNHKPSRPINVEAHGGREIIQLYWDYADELFIKHYEVYGSQVADFVPDSQHLLWRGQVSAFAHSVNTDETWYYYVRAVNYHGTPSDWSARVSASTTRIISDDILFGEDLAARLRELNRISDIIGENGVNFEQISEEAKDLLNQQARIYTDEEIEAVESKLMSDISNLSDSLEFVNGQLVDKVNIGDVYTIADIDGMFDNVVSITRYETDIAGVVKDLEHQESLIRQNEKEILNRVSETIFYDESDYLRRSIAETKIFAEGIEQTVSSIEIGGRNLALGTSSDLRTVTVSQYGYSGMLRVPIDNIKVSHGDEVTFSVYIQDIPQGESVRLRLDWYRADNTYSSVTAPASERTNKDGRYSFTATIPNDTSFADVRGRIMPHNWLSSYQVRIKEEQLESGNKATDWQPAPEDIDNRMTISESTITQLSKEIDLKVDVDGIVSQINLNREGIRIKGNLIHLDGLTLIDDGVITNAHIRNLSADKVTVGTMLGNRIQFNSLHGDKLIAGTVTADRLNVSYLSAINSNLGTVRAGRLLSSNNNMDLNLNTGTLSMNNADFTLGGGASIYFNDPGNRLYYSHYDSVGRITRSAGIGFGTSINNRFPFAFFGTTNTSRPSAMDSMNFTGFITNTRQRELTDGIGNSVIGNYFHIRDEAVSYSKGYLWDLSGSTITMHPMNTGTYNYYIGTSNGSIDRLYLGGTIYANDRLNIRNKFDTKQGWVMKTSYEGESQIVFAGLNASDWFNDPRYYNLGSTTNRFSYVYLVYQPDIRSDERVKENIRDNVLGLDFIKDIQTKNFNLINRNPNLEYEPIQYGLIAQQLMRTLIKHGEDVDHNSLVSQGKDGFYGVQYNQLIAPTIKAIQELDDKVISIESRYNDKVAQLEQKVAWLETENQFIKNEIKKLQIRTQTLEELVA